MQADQPDRARGSACERCGGKMELLTHIPTRLGEPPYNIFECADCGLIDWVTIDGGGL